MTYSGRAIGARTHCAFVPDLRSEIARVRR